MPAPLARYLVRFGAEQAPAPLALPPPPPDNLVSLSPEDWETQLAEARERGAEEARIATTAAIAEVLDAERQQADARLAEERAAWTETQADRLARDLEAGFVALENRLADSLARTLTPLLEEALRERLLAGLAETVATLLADDKHPLVRIAGPADLIEKLRRSLGTPRAVDYVAAETAEVTITADGTLIRSQVQAWLAAARIEPDREA